MLNLVNCSIGISTLIKRIETARKLLDYIDETTAAFDAQLIKLNALELDFWFITGIEFRQYAAAGGDNERISV